MRTPVRKIFAEAHMTSGTDAPSNTIDAAICSGDKSGTAAIRSIIIMGVSGGMNERMTATGSSGRCTMYNQATMGTTSSIMTGPIKLCASLKVLQAEPTAASIDAISRKPRT